MRQKQLDRGVFPRFNPDTEYSSIDAFALLGILSLVVHSLPFPLRFLSHCAHHWNISLFIIAKSQRGKYEMIPIIQICPLVGVTVYLTSNLAFSKTMLRVAFVNRVINRVG